MNDEGYSEQELSYVALERLLTTLNRARGGDFAARMSAPGTGVEQEVSECMNEVLSSCKTASEEIRRVVDGIKKGDLKVRPKLDKAVGGWLEQLRALDELAAVFEQHIIEMRNVSKGMLAGDFTHPIPVGPETVHRDGELLLAAGELNGLNQQLRNVLSEVTRVMGNVSIEGRFDSRLRLRTLTGAWALLVDATNALTTTLAEQVQDITATTRALAAGNLLARVSASCSGELQIVKLSLNETIESMAGMCGDIQRVAQEVTGEGKLAVALRQPDLRGEWLSAQLACNRTFLLLGTSLRTIAETFDRMLSGQPASSTEVATPGDIGDALRALNRLASQEQRTRECFESLLYGRFHELKASGTEREMQLFLLGVRLKQEWFRAARLGLVETHERRLSEREFAASALTWIVQIANVAAGAYYIRQGEEQLVQAANMGCEAQLTQLRLGEGLVGRVALDGAPLFLDQLDGQNVRVRGGMLDLVPRAVLVFPVKAESRVVAVLELCFTNDGGKTALELLEYLSPDLVAGARKHAELKDDVPEGLRARQPEEDLLIANTRVEGMVTERREHEKARESEGTHPPKLETADSTHDK